jgi:hypothetical protein
VSLQIKRVLLYNKDGRIREIEFRLGGVNIITGKSRTGKSALLRIVEYCLGKSDFFVPEGVIRDTIAWYGVLYQDDDTQILIAKPAPAITENSQSSAFLQIGTEIDTPSIDNLQINSNDAAINQELSMRIGISPNINIPQSGQSRDSLEANIKHTHPYIFQEQTLISNDKLLFHQQLDYWVSLAIKDTLPYFLGAVREDRLKIEQDLRVARRNLKMFQQRLAESEAIVSDSINRGQSLIIEAQQVGLLGEDVLHEDKQDIINELHQTQKWRPTEIRIEGNDRFQNLVDGLANLRNEFSQKKQAIDAAKSFAKEAEGFASEVKHQKLRLESINLFSEQQTSNICPLCSSLLDTTVPSIKEIMEKLSELDKNLFAIDDERPRLREHIRQLEDELSEIRGELHQKQLEIESIRQEQEAAQHLRDLNSRIARVVGRISLFLDTKIELEDNSVLRNQIEDAKKKVDALESLREPDITEDMLISRLNVISEYMTNLARTLKLEYPEYRYRLDVKKLTVVVDRPDRPITMERLGSAENWLGCHLITLLALHKYFVEQKRPVPGFLMLDQPSQGYFVSNDVYKALDGTIREITNLEAKDADLAAINRMFDLLFSFCNSLYPHFQIIVTEHANLASAVFQEALVEEPWRGNNALIPLEWLEFPEEDNEE